jgi:hypothetical protein
VIGAPSVTQQCLQLGLLDAIHIDLAPVVLGRGIRLFDHLTGPVELLVTEASGNPHVTHITYLSPSSREPAGTPTRDDVLEPGTVTPPSTEAAGQQGCRPL